MLINIRFNFYLKNVRKMPNSVHHAHRTYQTDDLKNSGHVGNSLGFEVVVLAQEACCIREADSREGDTEENGDC